MAWKKVLCFRSPKLCLAFGIFSLLMGIAFLISFGLALKPVLKEMLPIQEGTQVYEIWKSPNNAADIYSKYYFFDLQNADDALRGEKPRVVQKGPYVYREVRQKKDIAFNDNGTVSYREEKAYFFDRSMSAGSENDSFITVNVPIYGMGVFLRYEEPYIRELMDIVTEDFFKEPLFLNLTVYQLLWGYEDKMLKAFVDLAIGIKINLPPDLSTFGFFKGRNHSDAGVYTSWTGMKDLSRYMQISRWNGLERLDTWGTKYCNMLNGSDGEFYRPFLTKESKLFFYIPDVCRSLYMAYKKTVVVDGMTRYQFHYPPSAMASKWKNPDNAGFCTAGVNETCLGSGLINATSCHFGSPAVVSLPHFYGADDQYKDGILGLTPNDAEHDAIIELEPTTAVPTAAHIKMQLNLMMPRVPQFRFTEKLRKGLVFPILWFHESATISGSMVAQLRLLFVILPPLFDALGGLCLFIGLVTIILSSVAIYRRRKEILMKPLGPTVANGTNGISTNHEAAADNGPNVPTETSPLLQETS